MEFREISLRSIRSNNFDDLKDFLARKNPNSSFEVLLDQEIALEVAQQTGSREIQSWITRRRTWDAEEFTPESEFSPADQFLSILWQDLSLSLSRKMEVLRRNVEISQNSAIICFPGGSELSLLVSFSAASRSDAGRLRPLTVTTKPEGMLEMERFLDGTDRERKNELKKAIISVDKLTFFKDVVLHVNRQTEDVFGPTIDTVLIADVLSRRIQDVGKPDTSVLEVGPGSGLIAVSAASIEYVERVCAIEINSASAVCTLKNMQINGFKPASSLKSISVRAEKFAPTTLSERFDYVVCNPPYIPEVSASENFRASGYGAAISGLELYFEIFNSLDRLLRPNGRALFMMSSVSYDEVKHEVPAGYTIEECKGFEFRRVPLDLDLLWDRPEWREYLLDRGSIEQSESGQLFHKLIPVWIYRAE